MLVRPSGWSVVIAGRWNRAILTPAGIAKRVFRLPDAQKVMVAVPLDGISPYQVRHPTDDIIAMTDESRLLIHLVGLDYGRLEAAMGAGVNAMESLPETPVVAAGFNVNFEGTEITPEIARILASDTDSKLIGVAAPIAGRSLARSLDYGAGKLNVTLSGEQSVLKLSCNFHRDSDRISELRDWLQTPISAVRDTIGKLLAALDLEAEEVPDDTNDE